MVLFFRLWYWSLDHNVVLQMPFLALNQTSVSLSRSVFPVVLVFCVPCVFALEV